MGKVMISFRGIKKELFGYSKKDVMNYIEMLNEDLNTKLSDKDRQVKEVIEQNNILLKRLEKLEKTQDEIAYAIIQAKKSADLIVNDANKQAEKILKDTKENKQKKESEYNEYIEQIIKFKKQMTRILKSFVKEAENIKKECDEACRVSFGREHE